MLSDVCAESNMCVPYAVPIQGVLEIESFFLKRLERNTTHKSGKNQLKMLFEAIPQQEDQYLALEIIFCQCL